MINRHGSSWKIGAKTAKHCYMHTHMIQTNLFICLFVVIFLSILKNPLDGTRTMWSGEGCVQRTLWIDAWMPNEYNVCRARPVAFLSIRFIFYKHTKIFPCCNVRRKQKNGRSFSIFTHWTSQIIKSSLFACLLRFLWNHKPTTERRKINK